MSTFRALQAPLLITSCGAGRSRHHRPARRPAPGRPVPAGADRTGTRSRGPAEALRLPEAARLAGGLRRGDDPRRLLAGHPQGAADARRPPGPPRPRRSRHLRLQRLRQRRHVAAQRRRRLPAGAYTAGNIALFPKVDVVVASTGAFGRLRPAQRAVLRRAVAETRAASTGAAGERAAAAAFCRAGGTIVRATSVRGAGAPNENRTAARRDAARSGDRARDRAHRTAQARRRTGGPPVLPTQPSVVERRRRVQHSAPRRCFRRSEATGALSRSPNSALRAPTTRRSTATKE